LNRSERRSCGTFALLVKPEEILSRDYLDITTLKNSYNGENQNAKIEEQELVLCVPDVMRKSLMPGEVTTPVDLRPSP